MEITEGPNMETEKSGAGKPRSFLFPYWVPLLFPFKPILPQTGRAIQPAGKRLGGKADKDGEAGEGERIEEYKTGFAIWKWQCGVLCGKMLPITDMIGDSRRSRCCGLHLTNMN